MGLGKSPYDGEFILGLWGLNLPRLPVVGLMAQEASKGEFVQWFDVTTIWLLAQEGEGNGAGGPINPMMIIVMLVVLFYFMIIRPETKKKKDQQAQLESLKKNDRVVTVGGIYGTIASVNREADEIVLKIDESTGTKLRISVGSVSRLVGEKSDAESKQAGKK